MLLFLHHLSDDAYRVKTSPKMMKIDNSYVRPCKFLCLSHLDPTFFTDNYYFFFIVMYFGEYLIEKEISFFQNLLQFENLKLFDSVPY